jgi:hypothetical protein
VQIVSQPGPVVYAGAEEPMRKILARRDAYDRFAYRQPVP